MKLGRTKKKEKKRLTLQGFVRMNPSCFMGLITTEDLENFVEDSKKVFDVMHVANAEGVEIAAYQLKN